MLFLVVVKNQSKTNYKKYKKNQSWDLGNTDDNNKFSKQKGKNKSWLR